LKQGDPSLIVEGFSGDLELVEITGHEALHTTWRLHARCICKVSPVKSQSVWDLVGARATLLLPLGRAEEARTLHGILDDVLFEDEHFVFTVVPSLQVHEDAHNYRVLVDVSADKCASDLFEHACYEIARCLQREPPVRPQRVQFSEGGLGFAERLLAEEGIVWFFDPSNSNKIILADHPQAFPEYDGLHPLVLSDNLSANTGDTPGIFVWDAQVRVASRSKRVVLTDWNYKTPGVDISATHTTEAQDKIGIAHHHTPYGDTERGSELAQVYLQAHHRDASVFSASIAATELAPGLVITVEPGERANSTSFPGKWLITHVRHQGRAVLGGWTHLMHIKAVPAARGYRPSIPPIQRAGGVQTMRVSGPAGEEIHVDEDGRALVRHRWDREHPEDESASAWQRVVHPPMPGGMLLPRVGFEALTAFRGAAGDEPFLLGRLDNGAAVPKESLPAKQIASSFGSRSTPGGGGENGLSTDDSQGNEGMTITAQYNYDEATGNDKKATVVELDKLEVGTNRSLTVGQGQIEEVGTTQELTVGAQRTLNVGSNVSIQATDEIVGVAGARFFSVGGDRSTDCNVHVRTVAGLKIEACVESESRKVMGGLVVQVGGSCSVKTKAGYDLNVAGVSHQNVAGLKCIGAEESSEKVLGTLNEEIEDDLNQQAGTSIVSTYKNNLTLDVGGPIHAEGANIIFKAKTITVKAGGVTIRLADGKISIDGDLVVQSGGTQKTDVSI